MDLSKDFLSIQSIFRNVVKTTGDFTKINYKGGNEEKISLIIKVFREFLLSKEYITSETVNTQFKTEVENIIYFLILNTELKKSLDIEECAHLTNIIPQLSKCVLSSIIVDLNLGEYYSSVLYKLPYGGIAELLDELLPCLKKCDPKRQLEYTVLVLKVVIKKISKVATCDEAENVEKIVDASNELLRNLTGLQSDQSRNWKSIQIYQHMGHTLLNLLDMLLICDIGCVLLARLIERIMSTCCSIMQNVTINVFCTWAEIELDGQSLQTVISWKAYEIMEKYPKNKAAKELMQMLSTIAKKPKTLGELIREADASTMIKMINKVTPEQKDWFRALLGTQIQYSKEALKCVNLWAHLSSIEDVMLLLQLSMNSNNPEVKNVTVKCAACLPVTDLILVLTRALYKYGFTYVLNENANQQLMLLFNKMKGNIEDQDAVIQEIILLILQNPSEVMNYILGECLKNSFYTTCLKRTFTVMKDLANVSKFGVKTLNSVFSGTQLNEHNLDCYVVLLNTLIDLEYLNGSNTVINDVLFLHLNRSHEEKNFVEIGYLLRIMNRLNITLTLELSTEQFYGLLFHLLKESRCKFLNFDNIKQDIVREIVSVINKTNKSCEYTGSVINLEDADVFQTYYLSVLEKVPRNDLLLHLCPDYNFNNYAEAVSRLLQTLPCCVLEEWLQISSELLNNFGVEVNKIIELLTDVLVLLCQVAKSQESKEGEVLPTDIALGYCLRLYGSVIKDVIKTQTSISYGEETDNKLQNEIILAKNVCRLVRELPAQKKETIGLSLTGLLDENALKSLSKDKQFIKLVVSIQDKNICKTLAEKMIRT